MKPLKYALVLLFLCFSCCFLTATEAAEEETYTLNAILVDAYEGDDISASRIVVELFQDNSEVDLFIAEKCRFIASPLMTGLQTEQITFVEFAERFMGHPIDFDYVIYQDYYFVTECRLVIEK